VVDLLNTLLQQTRQFLGAMTAAEWGVVIVATAICLLGSLLPMIGNLLGRLLLGEDPLLARWRQQRLERKHHAQSARLERREAKKARKAAAQRKAPPTVTNP
jgi:hypothetical protein